MIVNITINGGTLFARHALAECHLPTKMELSGMDESFISMVENIRLALQEECAAEQEHDFDVVKRWNEDIEERGTTYYRIILQDYKKRIDTIIQIRRFGGWGLKEAKDLTDHLPATVGQNLQEDIARAFLNSLNYIGATAIMEKEPKGGYR